MAQRERVYIAGVGMITPLGADSSTIAAAVKAGISGYSVSDFYGENDEPITMASVPQALLSSFNFELETGNRFNDCHDRISKMAIYALQQACATVSNEQAIPIILTTSNMFENDDGLVPVLDNLELSCQPFVNAKYVREMDGDRSIGMEAIAMAFQHLRKNPNGYVLVGGSDSYLDYSRLAPLIEKQRLLTTNSMDGFAPGEGACFLLLTGNPDLAVQYDGNVTAMQSPGIAKEEGHLNSDTPYLGEGLDQAFKRSFESLGDKKIQAVFSSMNGESYWAKELGVAYMRNSEFYTRDLETFHPADIYGDLGVPTTTVLIGLAKEYLFEDSKNRIAQVYCSSDSELRGSIVIEKIPAAAA